MRECKRNGGGEREGGREGGREEKRRDSEHGRRIGSVFNPCRGENTPCMHIGADSDTTGYTTGSPPTTCVIETTLDKVSRWIGSGPRTTLAGDANADT